VSGTKSDAATRGTAVHDLVEAWAQGRPTPVLAPELEGYGRAFDSFCHAWRPKALHSECVIVNRTHKYAGRLDLIAQLGGETWLIDFKTAKSVWADYGLQLAAYKNAEFFRLPKESNDPTLYPMPQVDKTGVVLLRPNGTFDFVQTDEPFEVFLALMRVHEWLKSK